MSTKLHIKFILPLLVIPVIALSIWFKNGLITGGGDEALIFYDPTRMKELSSQTWLDAGTGFPVLFWLSRANFLSIISFLHEKLYIPTYLLETITFYSLMVVGSLSTYFIIFIFVKKLPKGYLISLISAFFYLLNPFSISQIWARGLFAQYFSFALLPLALLIFAIGFQKKSLFWVIPFCLVTYLFSTAFGVVTLVPTLWFLLFLFLLFNFSVFGLLFFAISLLLWILISSWWLLPLLISGNNILVGYLSNPDENLGTLMGVSKNFPPEIIIRLLQKTYFFDAGFDPTVYAKPIFQLLSLISPTFMIYGLFRIFKLKLTKQFSFLFLIFVVGLLVSLGANPPLGNLFVFIFKHISFLQSFRNPYEKFGLVYSFGYSFLFAFGAVYFADFFRRLKFIVLSLILILICGIFAWPFWSGRVVAGPDRNIGIPVPSSYKDLQNWLDKNGGDYRLVMTPLWGGEGAFYNWSGTRYQGVDPMPFIIQKPAISAAFQIPFYLDYILNMRRYMQRIDLAPSLALLRGKFLVNRQDAIMLSESEKLHPVFLTQTIYPPLNLESMKDYICQNQSANTDKSEKAWIVCKLTAIEGNWKNIKYIHILVKTFTPAFLEVIVKDNKGITIRWDGRNVNEYKTDNNDWTETVLPLAAPSEYNPDLDFSNVAEVELLAHPKDNQLSSVYEISLKGIKLDAGQKKETNEFQLMKTFSNLQLFQASNFIAPPEFGVLSSAKIVSDFPKLFEEAFQARDELDKKGFILLSQNKNNLPPIKEYLPKVVEKEKISDTRFWLKVSDVSNEGLLILSKTFNSQWKIISGVSEEKLKGGFQGDWELLHQAVISEDNHYVVNGYANLWKIGGNNQYAILFIPQIVADLGGRISNVFLLGISGLSVIWLFVKFRK